MRCGGSSNPPKKKIKTAEAIGCAEEGLFSFPLADHISETVLVQILLWNKEQASHTLADCKMLGQAGTRLPREHPFPRPLEGYYKSSSSTSSKGGRKK